MPRSTSLVRLLPVLLLAGCAAPPATSPSSEPSAEEANDAKTAEAAIAEELGVVAIVRVVHEPSRRRFTPFTVVLVKLDRLPDIVDAAHAQERVTALVKQSFGSSAIDGVRVFRDEPGGDGDGGTG